MKINRLFPAIIMSLILLVITTGMRPLAPAATINVTTKLDEYDYPGSGEGCSLREAITAANSDSSYGGCPAGGPGADIIQLPPGIYLLTRYGPNEDSNVNGDLDITSEIEMVGTGSVIISGGFGEGIQDRVIDVSYTTGHLTLTNLTITGGRAPVGALNANGYEGGGIRNNHSLTLIGVTVTDNYAGDGGNGGDGGGIYSSNTLSIQGSTISNNWAGNGLVDTTIDGSGGYGGGIFFTGSSLSIINSSITSNTAGAGTPDDLDISARGGPGGGIYFSCSTDCIITGTTISGNTAGASLGASGGAGGGIYANSNLTLENSTISGNTSGSSISGSQAAGTGGGVSISYGLVSMRYSTVYDNHLGSGIGISVGGGIYVASTGGLTLGASILAGNSDGGGSASDCYAYGTTTSEDYNLVGNIAGCTFTGPTGNSFMGMPGFSLSPLGNHGGSTQTHALPAGNLVIDRIPDATYGCGTTYSSDQRGWVRPADGNDSGTDECDMGAFEYHAPSGFLPLIRK
jgi:CSLREA domain-containing protein